MKKVLIIEDSPEFQELCKTQLTQAGYSVIQAVNGKDGIAAALTHKPQLILLDIMLPHGLNGFDVLKKLKIHPALTKIPVIVFTNLESEEKTAFAMGAKDFIRKTDITIPQ
ncbi:response regulator, partial [Candidatus Roizmanbacteria bacterium]|nr:response regulator [Candidatus Roizmanbacteria bacterium]